MEVTYKEVDVLDYIRAGIYEGVLKFYRVKRINLNESSIPLLEDKTMLATKIYDNLQINLPCKEGVSQKIRAGGYLLMDPTNSLDVSGIEEEEFNNTYIFINKPKTKIRR